MTTTTPTAQAAAAANATTNATSSTAQAAGANATQQLAGNFNTFLTLLTTQLKNQNPLDPLDTNQFTQQLVEFASVEQQVNMNTNMQTLISLQQTNEATSALQFLGTTVTVSGKTATLSNATGAPAAWTLSSPGPATAQRHGSGKRGLSVRSRDCRASSAASISARTRRSSPSAARVTPSTRSNRSAASADRRARAAKCRQMPSNDRFA
jgi:flagellar basal-body rod modification protein FlgD